MSDDERARRWHDLVEQAYEIHRLASTPSKTAEPLNRAVDTLISMVQMLKELDESPAA